MSRTRRALLVALSSLSLAGAFTACGPRPTPQNAPAETMSEEEALERFHEQKTYTYCDAKLLADLWDADLDEAKTTIGQRADDASLTSDLDAAYNHASETGFRCDFYDLAFTYDDADALVDHLGVESTWDAKLWIAEQVSTGQRQAVFDALGAATPQHHVEELDESVLYTAFEVSGYTYCDAEILAAYWSSEARDAQIAIGYKITNGYDDLLASEMAAARQAAMNGDTRCDWGSAVAFNDVEALSAHWGLGMEETKIEISEILTWGEEARIWSELQAYHGISPLFASLFERGAGGHFSLRNETTFEQETKVTTSRVACHVAQVHSTAQGGLLATHVCNNVETSSMEGFHAFFADKDGLWLTDPKADPAYLRERPPLLTTQPAPGEETQEGDEGLGTRRTITAGDDGAWCSERLTWGGDEVWEKVCLDAERGVLSLETGFAGGGTITTTYTRVDEP